MSEYPLVLVELNQGVSFDSHCIRIVPGGDVPWVWHKALQALRCLMPVQNLTKPTASAKIANVVINQARDALADEVWGHCL